MPTYSAALIKEASSSLFDRKLNFLLSTSGVRKGDKSKASQHYETRKNAVDLQFITDNSVVSVMDTYSYLISFMAHDLIPPYALGVYQKDAYNPKTFEASSGNVHIDGRKKIAWFFFDKCVEYGNPKTNKVVKLSKCNNVEFNDNTSVLVRKDYNKQTGFRNAIYLGNSRTDIINKNLLALPANLIEQVRSTYENVKRQFPKQKIKKVSKKAPKPNEK